MPSSASDDRLADDRTARAPGRPAYTAAGAVPDDVVARAARGDPVAARTLYDALAGRVYSTVRRLAGDAALADDWAQDAWVRVFRALPSYRGEAPLSAWVHRIAVNTALYARRRLARRGAREEALPDDLTVEASQEIDVERALTADRLERALSRVPTGMRAVLVLHDVEGYTHEEIAAMLGCTPGTSKSQLFKARARLRGVLRARPAAETTAETES